MIAIVNYGLGNVGAFANVYKRMNIPARLATTAAELEGVDRLILPGVGSFDHAMQLLEESGMRDALEDLVVNRGVPVLGVCVGMQILADGSDEGTRPGLGWIPGRVHHFSRLQGNVPQPLPHMGWNDVSAEPGAPLFQGLETDARFYFLHSFYFDCTDASHASARADYGGAFTCAVGRGNVHGVQFHPEKSHHWGGALLKNFARI